MVIDKEIERLNNELKIYKDNHEHLNNLLEYKDNIVKEIREYIEENIIAWRNSKPEVVMLDYDKIMEILDKRRINNE